MIVTVSCSHNSGWRRGGFGVEVGVGRGGCDDVARGIQQRHGAQFLRTHQASERGLDAFLGDDAEAALRTQHDADGGGDVLGAIAQFRLGGAFHPGMFHHLPAEDQHPGSEQQSINPETVTT
jgi:hypothetical protein